MLTAVKRHCRDLQEGRPGHRFQASYQRAHHQGKKTASALLRVARMALAVVCVAIGIILTVTPGPAFVFFILAGGLLATESLWMAEAMDWAEVKVRAVLHWLHQKWVGMGSAARVLACAVVLAAAAAGLYLSYRVFIV